MGSIARALAVAETALSVVGRIMGKVNTSELAREGAALLAWEGEIREGALAAADEFVGRAYGVPTPGGDEATAIFKCTNNPPVGPSNFMTYEGLPSDHYLWLTGQIGRLMQGEIEATSDIPKRQSKHGGK